MSILRCVDADQCGTAGHSGQLAVPLLNLLVLNQGVGQAFRNLLIGFRLRLRLDGGLLGFRLCIGDGHLLVGFRLGNGGGVLDLLAVSVLLGNGLLLDGRIVGFL